MTITTYTGLQNSIAGWLHRSDLAANIPDFIALAEARIARDLRLRAQIVIAPLVCTPSAQQIALPSDYLEAENLSITVAGLNQAVNYVTSETGDVRMPNGLASGSPSYFTVLGTNLMMMPTPDQAYPVSLAYYARIAALSVTPTNFLLTAAPGVYLFGALAEAAPFMEDDQRAALWETKYSAEVTALQNSDEAAVRSGAAMRVRTL